MKVILNYEQFGSERFNAEQYLNNILIAIREAQKQGLKVGVTKDNTLYVENTCARNGINEKIKNTKFAYCEAECFAD